jgi:hypothetical protein
MTQENTVISILFINGMEIVGRFVSETNVELKVYKPRMAQMSTITATGKEIDGEFTFSKNSIMYYTESVDQMVTGWQQQTSGLIAPAKSSIIS